jgi:LCP family protein required for cell wall assembly
MVISGAVLAVISLGTLAIVYGVSGFYLNKVDREDILDGVPQAPVGENQAMTFLLLGSDSRDGQDVQSLGETGYRSDVIMLVHVKADRSGAFIVSIPRDSYVNIPAGGEWGGGQDKITHAMMYGGANLTARTVYDLTQVPLTGAMVVNFNGMQNMVSAVGGVNVCTPVAYESSFTHRWFDVGCYDLTPEEAEFWARERYNLPGADFGRIKNQQEIIKGLMKKVTSTGMLADPGGFNSLLTAAAESLTVDQSLDLRDLAFRLKDINPANVKFATAPHTGTGMVGDQSVVFLDVPAVNELFTAVREEKTDEWIAAHPESQAEIASF